MLPGSREHWPKDRLPSPRSRRDVWLLAGILFAVSLVFAARGAHYWRRVADVSATPAREMSCAEYVGRAHDVPGALLRDCYFDFGQVFVTTASGRAIRVCGALRASEAMEPTSVVLCTEEERMLDAADGRAELDGEVIPLPLLRAYTRLLLPFEDRDREEIAKAIPGVRDDFTIVDEGAPHASRVGLYAGFSVAALAAALAWLVVNRRRRREYEAAQEPRDPIQPLRQ